MFCPNCGFQNQGESNFCKRCGTNLRVVAQALGTRRSAGSDDEIARRRALQDQTLKKRREYLTGGLCTASVGIAMMAFLYSNAGIKGSLIGAIPLMVGLGLILSALLVYKPGLFSQGLEQETTGAAQPVGAAGSHALPSSPESVTVDTTRVLDEVKQPPRAVE